ncbi:MAG: Do family serine endopeptidase [Proteobacteria bacterium]|nr:Do family serine endopeptidase [Pseudomonadota bacterium]
MHRCRLFAVIALFALVFPAITWATPNLVVPASKAEIHLSFAPVVKKVKPAVVNIYTQKVVRQRVISPFMGDPLFQYFFGGGMPGGMTRERLEKSLGSGVLIRPDGLIVTSNHVVDGADEVQIVLADKREFEAKVISSDKRTDLAFLKIDPRGEQLPFIELKNSDGVEVGDLVLAIGNPFGVGQTVTSGIVSAQARTNVDGKYYIQTDAAINPGNSGGALVGTDGRLVGINTAIYSKDGGNLGIGFAIPSNMVSASLSGLSADSKHIVRPWTGIETQELTQEMAASLGLVRPTGILVKSIHSASPALKKGLKVGDLVTQVNGVGVDDPSAFLYRIATLPVGQDVTLSLVRAQRGYQLSFKLIQAPEIPARQEIRVRGRNPFAGGTFVNLSPAVVEEYGLQGVAETGVILVETEEGSLVEQFGLSKGDVIVKVNDDPIKQTGDLQNVASGSRSAGWRMVIMRGGQLLKLFIRG